MQEPDQKAKENFPVVLMWPSFKTVFRVVKKTLCCVQVYPCEETLQPAQVTPTKMPRNVAKIYQETDFLSTEEHYFINYIWLLPDFNFFTGCCAG